MSTLYSVRVCNVYRVPPRATAAGYRAAEWGNMSQPLWSGRLRVVEHAETCEIRLEDGTTGELFASCPYDVSGKSVEATLDSSRCFVVRVESDDGRHAFIGIGFAERSESFDFTVALQDWTRRRKSELAGPASDEAPRPSPHLPDGPRQDFSLREGETLSLRMPALDASPVPSAAPAQPGFQLPPPPPGGRSK
ncbi:hypothetical protein MEQU1_001300 [Malassezia equina]|uniref:NECAP PHear domain-containing protein n=1 Tax=Malassezia equina TaxID=1381935 RepID=A0AAF0IY86_9BASI|nr:hypothetical protein MEQU1_001300 [Malassezia equina]